MRTENYYIDYRYIPGALGTGSSLDNGSVMRESRRTAAAAQKLLAEIKADPRIQWATLHGSHVSRSASCYGGPA